MFNPILLLLVSVVAGGLFVLLRLLHRTSLLFFLKQWWVVSVEDRFFHAHQSFKVPQFNDHSQENQLYRRVSAYLNSLPSLEDTDSINLFTKSKEIVLSLDPSQTLTDSFLGARLFWTNDIHVDDHDDAVVRSFVLKMRRSDRRRILHPYLQHIHAVSDEIEQRRREVKVNLYMNTEPNNSSSRVRWRLIPFTHPATMETVVLDQDSKGKVKSDLEQFLKSKQYYHRLGRVWRRSYLLYGPSGTGKSSFVAAMARFLCYDVYDVDLSRVSDDLDLKTLLLQTSPRSLIVIEDLDRFFDRSTAAGVSISGMLCFMDGIFSCCGGERVMVFTMNCKDRIDPAVLRPGRVDVHVHFPPCDFSAFKSLASTHLGVRDHKLFPQVEEVFQGGACLTPAEIGEIMISNRTSPTRALKSVITAARQSNNHSPGGKVGAAGQRLCADGSGEQPGGGANVMTRESIHMVREFRKLYGLLRMRSGRKEDLGDVDPNPSPAG